MAKTESVNGYTLNKPGRKEPWGNTEYDLLKAMAQRQPPAGSYLATTQHILQHLAKLRETIILTPDEQSKLFLYFSQVSLYRVINCV